MASLKSLFVLSESPEILHQRPHGGPWDGNNPNNMNTNVSVSIFDFSLQITNSRTSTFYILRCRGRRHFNLFFQYILQARETSMIYLLFHTTLQLGHNIPLFHDKLAHSLLSGFYSFWGTLNLNGFEIVPMDSKFETKTSLFLNFFAI